MVTIDLVAATGKGEEVLREVSTEVIAMNGRQYATTKVLSENPFELRVKITDPRVLAAAKGMGRTRLFSKHLRDMVTRGMRRIMRQYGADEKDYLLEVDLDE